MKKMIKPSVVVENIMDAWNVIINSSMKEYSKFVIRFRSVCAIYLDLLKYVKGTIFDQVKENIVCIRIDQVRYFGNTTTNRVESTHARLKNWLRNSKSDFCQDWDVVNQML